MKLTVCFFLLTSFANLASSASVLLLSYLPSGSHTIWFNKIANLLLQRGHEVILLGTGPIKTKSDNLTFFLIEDSYNWLAQVEKTLKETSLLEMVNGLSSATDNIKATSDWSTTECGVFLKSQGSKSLMNRYKGKRIDLIIVDFACDCFLGFVHYFNNPPFIIATPYNNAFNIFDSVGLFDNPSYVPTPFAPFEARMSFTERSLNLFYKLYSYYLWKTVNIPLEDVLAKEVFGTSTPHVSDILNNATLLLVGLDPALTAPKPLPPACIPVGGLHIDKVKPLPQDIKKFLDEANDGVIYFSFGSNFKSIFMTPDMIQMFLDVFKDLPQRVVWKLEREDKTGVPPNVLISKWLPQNDILGHPNVRCFISHGGLLGTQEAIYHGIPILSLPFMFDQLDLAVKLQKNGVGIRLEFAKLSKTYIKENILKVMEKSYKKKMQEWSMVFRDSPMSADERAIWWIEYVLRNPNRSHQYLRTESMSLYWFQRLLLDVAAAFLVPLITLLYLIYRIMSVLLAKIFSKSSSEDIVIKKKNKRE